MRKAIIMASVLSWLLSGCQKPVYFPEQSLQSAASEAGASAAFDAKGRGKADFFLFADSCGRVKRIGYDTTGNGKLDTIVDTDAIPFDKCRHLVIILDGFGYEVIKKFYDAGNLRAFYPPSRVIASYP